MKKSLCFLCLILAVSCFVLFNISKVVVREAVKQDHSLREKYDEIISGWEKANDQLTKQVLEGNKEINKLYDERDAALLRISELLLQRDEAFADVRRVSEEFAKALNENDRLRVLIEAKDDAIRHLDGDVNCLKAELKRAESCVKCHKRSHK